MRIYDVLYSMNTGNAKPKARPFDNLLGQALSSGEVEKTATGNPVSIVTNKAQNAISTLLSYTPKQSGTGDPSPQNIRPIEGWTEANLGVNSETPTKTISLGGTYYGFIIDLERGVLRVTHKVHTITGDMVTNATKDGVSWQLFLNPPLSEEDRALLAYTPIKCNRYVGRTSYNEVTYNNNSVGMNYSLFSQILVHDESLTSLADIVSSLNATPMQIYYELRTKKEIPLTPQTVALLAGNNTLWTDGDSIEITYKAKKA